MSFTIDPTSLAVTALEEVSAFLKTQLTPVYDDAGQRVHDGYSRAIQDLDLVIHRTKVVALGGRVNRNHAQAAMVHIDTAASLPGDDPRVETYLLRSYIHSMLLNAESMANLAASNDRLAASNTVVAELLDDSRGSQDAPTNLTLVNDVPPNTEGF